MKAVTALLIFTAIVSAGGCRKAPAPTAAEPGAADVTKSKPETPVAPSPKVAESRPPRIATPGIYYLLDRYSKVTESGVYAISPGGKLTRLKEGKTEWLMTDGTLDFAVKPNQVTNDLDLADLARATDAASKTKLAEIRRERAVADGPGIAKQRDRRTDL